MNRSMWTKILTFFAYILAQVLLFNKIVLFDTAFCFVYIGFLLTFPMELTVISGMLIGFATGLSIDMFTNTLGLHASASVLMMAVRPRLLSIMTPHGGYPANVLPRPQSMGLGWFSTYALILIFIHQLLLFFVEHGGFSMFWSTLTKAVSSTLFTFVMIVLVQYLFAPKSEKR